MKIEFRQAFIGWCGVYTIANVFKKRELLKYLGNEKFKGCSDEESDILLAQALDGWPLKMGNIITVNQDYAHIPKDYIWEIVSKEDTECDVDFDLKVAPYFLSVRVKKEYYHAVAILNIQGHGLFYINPINEDIIELTGPEILNDLFIDCCAIQRPYRIEDKKYIVLNGEYFGWDELLKKEEVC